MATLLQMLSEAPVYSRYSLAEILQLAEIQRPNRIARLQFVDPVSLDETYLFVFEPLIGGIVWIGMAMRYAQHSYINGYVLTGENFTKRSATIIKSMKCISTMGDLLQCFFIGNGFISTNAHRITGNLNDLIKRIISYERVRMERLRVTQAEIETRRKQYPFVDVSEYSVIK